MLVCWKSDGYSCGKSIYQIFEALSLYTILFNYSTFYLGFVGVTFFSDFHWAWLGLGKKLNWFPVLMNSLLPVKSYSGGTESGSFFSNFISVALLLPALHHPLAHTRPGEGDTLEGWGRRKSWGPGCMLGTVQVLRRLTPDPSLFKV